MKKVLIAVSILVLLALLAVGCEGTSPATNTSQTTLSTTTRTSGNELSLDIFEPQDEAIIEISHVKVSGRTLPDAVVSINGIIADIDAQGIFTGEVSLDAGPNSIEVIASDFYGKEKSTILTVVYAAALPLTVTEPLNDSVVTSQTVLVKGTTNTDAVVSVNGKVVSVDAMGSFIEPTALDVGPNFIEVLASDFTGNSATVTIVVIYSP